MSTLEDLLAQQAGIEQQQAAFKVALAVHEKPLIEQALAALSEQPVADLVALLTSIRAELPSGPPGDLSFVGNEQIGNIIIVLASLPSVLTDRLAVINTMVAAPPPPPPGEGE